MVLASLLILLGQRYKNWPVATSDNGYAQYIAAAKLMDAPFWKGIVSKTDKDKSPATYREEAKHIGPIFAAIKKANSMPVYDPRKDPTYSTLYPEYAALNQVAKAIRDAAHARALDGDWDGASNWLIEADRFADRLPVTQLISLLVRQRELGILRRETEIWLPHFSARQLRAQASELQKIADHQPDVRAVVQDEIQILHRSIRMTVDDPSTLGIPDEATDVSASLDKVLNLPDMSPELTQLVEKLMKAAPAEAQKDPAVGLKYLEGAESQVPTQDREAFDKYLEAMRAAIKPKTYSLSAYAKTLDAESKAHAVKIIEVYTGSSMKALAESIGRAERDWWLKFTPPDDKNANAEVMKDGKEGKFARVDFFALQLADVINKLSMSDGNDWTYLCQNLLLEREKARLVAVDAQIQLYRALHHRLPANLKAIGAPRDPLGKRPYQYRRTSARTYELAAVGIPGVGRIEEKTKPDPERG